MLTILVFYIDSNICFCYYLNIRFRRCKLNNLLSYLCVFDYLIVAVLPSESVKKALFIIDNNGFFC